MKVEDKAALVADLEESVETMEVRVNSLGRQETSLQEKYKTLSESINAAMGNARPAAPSDEE